jgi:hypothetical protein
VANTSFPTAFRPIHGYDIIKIIEYKKNSPSSTVSKEALIKSLSDFILGFLCNARNNSTRIASYLRQQSCIGLLSQGKLALSLHIKAPSFYPWPDYDEAVHKNLYEI